MTDLPPLDQPNAYVVLGPDDQRGPYTLELLISEVVAGRLQDATPVWWPGIGDWTTFSANPAVAAEIQRRRSGAQAPTNAFAPQPQPGQPQAGQAPQAGADLQAATAGADVSSSGADAAAAPYDQASDLAPIEVEPTAADFEAVGRPVEGFRAGSAMGLDPMHGQNFADLIRRSRARAEAAAMVEQIDERFTESLLSATNTLGLSMTSHSDEGGMHDMQFEDSGGGSLSVSLTQITGHLVADPHGHVTLDITWSTSGYEGASSTDTGEHGEIVVTAGGPDAISTASVSLLLALEDYVSADHIVDTKALERDFAAVAAQLAHSLEGWDQADTD